MRLDREQLTKVFQQVWDYCLKSQAERGVPYVSATDVHRRLRAHLAEILNNVPIGTYGSDLYLSGPPLRTSVSLQDCRTWLLNQVSAGKLRIDNGGKGHCSGARFRPVEVGLTDAEEERAKLSREEKARRKHIRHLKGKDNRPACLPPRKPGRFEYPRRHPFYFANPESEYESQRLPSCKKCLKIVQAGPKVERSPTCTVPAAV